MKLYPQLNSYMISKRPESRDMPIYMGSSCKFRTQREYLAWIRENFPERDHMKMVICKERK